MHLTVPFALCNSLVDILKGENLDVHEDTGHWLVLVVLLISECHSPYPVPYIGHPDGALSVQFPWAIDVVCLRCNQDGQKCVWSPHKGGT